MKSPAPLSRALLPVLAVLMCLSACVTRMPPLDQRGCPVVPADSRSLGGAANLRARMEIRSRDHRIGFEVVSRAVDDELIVIGLSPHGTRLFTVHQRGREFDVEPTASPMLQYVALWVVDALHRSHWIEPARDARGAVAESDRAGETLRESGTGATRRREFVRTDPPPAVVGVAITYSRPTASSPTGRIEIRNAWCDYDASIVILDERTPAPGT